MAVNPKKSAKSVLLMIRLFSKNPFKRSCYENTIGLLRIVVEKQVFISNRYRCTTRNTYRPLRGRSQTTFIRQGRYVGGPKMSPFVNIHTIENVNAAG